MNPYDSLKLENQVCFPLYAAAREAVKLYNPFLSEIDLTYTQYVTMMVLWEKENLSVKTLGEKLYLDSGTLTPLLKSLEKKGFIKRERSKEDERFLIVSLTKEGKDLREKALPIPEKVYKCVNMSKEDSLKLYQLLYQLLNTLHN